MPNLVFPPISPSIAAATVVRWLRKPGEPIAAGDALVELEADESSIVLEAASSRRRLSSRSQNRVKPFPLARVLARIEHHFAASAPAKLRRIHVWTRNQVPRAARSSRS